MKTFGKSILGILRGSRNLALGLFLLFQIPEASYSQRPAGLQEVNDALEDETENVIQTGRLVGNIIVVISFILLMLNIAFKVMDNSRATVVFLFVLFLRGLFEVIF